LVDSVQLSQSLCDEVLTARVGAQDQEAFDELYQRYVRPVAWMARSLLPSAQSAEDAVQETFLILWKKAGRIVLEGESVLPWLLGVCRIESRSILSKTGREDLMGEENTPGRASTNKSPEDRAIEVEALDRIELLVDRMSVTDQAIYRLCLVKELSYESAAKELGITHGAVRNRLSRLKARLRGHHQPHGTGAQR
jgi:RNA polymerase sigma-70 factor (ECF subfamily)